MNYKTMMLLAAMLDCYRDEEDRELYAFGKIQMNPENVTEDFTAMLLAMHINYMSITGDTESDLIDFTHILNKLAVQYVMDNNKNIHG